MIVPKPARPPSAKQRLSRRIPDAVSALGRIFLRSLRSSSPASAGLKVLGFLVILAAFWAEFRSAPNDPSGSNSGSSSSSNFSSSKSGGRNGPIRIGAAANSAAKGDDPVGFRAAPTDQALAPGELPGYTGWARPERTLARFFDIESVWGGGGGEGSWGSAQGTYGYGYECVVRVRCAGHKDCFGRRRYRDKRNDNDNDDDGGGGPSLFYLRAYGPAVVSGTVAARSCGNASTGNAARGGDASGESLETEGSGCAYDFRFVFYDPGLYTIEAVLTFSDPPPVSVFPLSEEANEWEPHYEGYLLPGFPLLADVVLDGGERSPKDNDSDSDSDSGRPLCSFEDLTETSPTSARDKARWKVTGRANGRGYSSDTMNSPIVSKAGFQNNANALGIRMEYRHTNRCRILPESSFRNVGGGDDDGARQRAFPGTAGGNGPGKIHVAYIGDSVMRVQKDVLRDLVKTLPEDAPELEFSFLSLHGGYRKNQVLGPANLGAFLSDLRRRAEADADAGGGRDVKTAVLFNTGLHDIHRLCGSEFRDERPSYLGKNSVAVGGSSSSSSLAFSCATEYEALLRDFLRLMDEFPAALKVFQTTTSAWPKYGNFGIQWSEGAQDMPLVSDFSAAFNEIAFGVLAELREEAQTNNSNENSSNTSNNHGSGSRIEIMDGYWITHPRPDNRETGDIGKKLSHPGSEVLSAMARTWWMLIRERLCQQEEAPS